MSGRLCSRLTDVPITCDAPSDSDRATLAHSLSQALQIFEDIHASVLRGKQLHATLRGGAPTAIKEPLKRISTEDDSFLSDPSSRGTANSSQLSSEHSQLTPLLSSDVNSHDSSDDRSGTQAEAETMDTDAPVAYTPSSPSIAPVVVTAALGEEHDAHDADDETHGTPHDRTQDSEDSVLSGHSSSKTPPPKPIRIMTVASASSADASVSATVQEVVVVDDDVHDGEEEAAADEANGSEKEPAQALDVTVDAAAVEPVAEDKDGAVSDVQDDSAATASSATDELPATAPEQEVAHDDDEKAKEQQQTIADAAADAEPSGSAAAPTAHEQRVDEDGANVTQSNGDAVDDQEEEDEPLVAAPATTTEASESLSVSVSTDGASVCPPQPQERWLPTIAQDDDSPDSQTNASEGAGIFDDETQLSQ